MTNDKHSFVLYTEYMRPLAKLTNEQRGQVLTALMAYTDGTELPEMDAAAEIAFEFIANQIDADTAKWEATKQARREAGSKGGQQKQTNSSKSKQTVAKVSKSKQTEANQAVNVNVNVNDNVNVLNNKYISPEQCSEPPAITLPLNTGEEYPITQKAVDELQKLYPAVDAMQELRNMRGWSLGNPKNRKTAAGINRFVHGWLSKAQNQARTTRPARKKTDSREQREYDYADLEASLAGGAT